MYKVSEDRLIAYGIGIKTTTYFKLMYPIYTGVASYGIVHLAVFGMN